MPYIMKNIFEIKNKLFILQANLEIAKITQQTISGNKKRSDGA